VSALVGPLLNIFLSLFFGLWVRYYPLRGRLRLPLPGFFLFYALFFAVQCAGYAWFTQQFGTGYIGVQVYKGISGIAVFLLRINNPININYKHHRREGTTMQNRIISFQYIQADQEKRALGTIMEAIFGILHDESSSDTAEGENNDCIRGSA
jgi:hypothetical protein